MQKHFEWIITAEVTEGQEIAAYSAIAAAQAHIKEAAEVLRKQGLQSVRQTHRFYAKKIRHTAESLPTHVPLGQ